MTDAYRALVASLPRPSAEQTARFVDFVAGAHSWYKHLPILPPGAPFTFFLDPNAGCQLVHLPSGREAFLERTDERDRFHYTWMSTSEYRERFGYWAYFTDRGTSFFVPGTSGLNDTSQRIRVLSADGEWLALPSDLVSAGTCRVTGLIHRNPASWAFFELKEKTLNEFRAYADAHPDDPDVTVGLSLLDFKSASAELYEPPDGGPR